jgi:ABC-2 type transport system ATP-binding protein
MQGRSMPANQTSRDGSAPLLRVDNLTKRYGRDGLAIDRVTFSVMAGEILGVIGPNGAGKTTVLEAIAGLLPMNSGAISWSGEPLTIAGRRDALFYLPDGVHPYRDQFVWQVLSFVARVFRRSDAEVRASIEALGLQPVLSKRVHALSKGFARRLMLTLGLLAPHELLLMDEPFDGFDLRQTREVIGLLREQTARGRTLILSIHQLADAQRVCDRFILLSAGRVRGIGGLADLRAQTGLGAGSLEDIFLALT